MIYYPEMHYFRNRKTSYSKAAQLTAQALLKYSAGYKARLVIPIKRAKDKNREGAFPSGMQKKKALLEILSWLQKNSLFKNIFSLRMYRTFPPQKDEPALFSYDDDGCCWYLDLHPSEFRELQKNWKRNGFPEDLFYSEDKIICRKVKGGLISRMLGVKSQRYYSPKEWEMRNKK